MPRFTSSVVGFFAIGLGAITTTFPASGQVPVPGAPDCVCLRIAADALAADLAVKQQTYDSLRNEIGQIDNQLDRERARMAVSDPAGVSPAETARFRQLLERRDMLFQQSNGPVFGALRTATEHYGVRAQEYNARCAGRPMDPGLVAQALAMHACPPPY